MNKIIVLLALFLSPNASFGSNILPSSDGQLVIGDTSHPSNPAKATLTAGSGVTITNGHGSITVAASGSSFTQPYELINEGLSTSVASNAMTIALKQADGTTDPASGSGAVKIGFRSSTATSGAYNERSVTGALSVVIPSGTTIGTVSGVATQVYIYALDNSGTVELAVSLYQFPDGTVQSSSAISGGSSNTTLYSTTARSNVPIRLIGSMKVSESTAGTWASNASNLAVTSVPTLSGIKRCAAYVTYRSSTPTIDHQDTDQPAPSVCVASIAQNSGGSGHVTVTFPTGFFSATPICVCSSQQDGSGNTTKMCLGDRGIDPLSATSWSFEIIRADGVLFQEDFTFFCIGH